MGIMGLRHLLYFASRHTAKLREMVHTQQQQDNVETQYPVATAAMNISQLLISIFNVGSVCHHSSMTREEYSNWYLHSHHDNRAR